MTATSLLVEIGDCVVFGDLSRSTKDALSSNDYELFHPKSGYGTNFGTPQFEHGGFFWGGGRNIHHNQLLQHLHSHTSHHGLSMPHSFGDLDLDDDFEDERLSNSEEDQMVRETTGEFAGWVEAFVRRVIQLIENLPEEGANGGVGGGVSEGTWSFVRISKDNRVMQNVYVFFQSSNYRCGRRRLRCDLYPSLGADLCHGTQYDI
jgi:hypothetical protein